jgi:hypothetical protein
LGICNRFFAANTRATAGGRANGGKQLIFTSQKYQQVGPHLLERGIDLQVMMQRAINCGGKVVVWCEVNVGVVE